MFSCVYNFRKLSGYSTWSARSFTPKILIFCPLFSYLLSPSPLFLYVSLHLIPFPKTFVNVLFCRKKVSSQYFIALPLCLYIFDWLVLSHFLSYSLPISLSASTNLIKCCAYRRTSPAPAASTFYQ